MHNASHFFVFCFLFRGNVSFIFCRTANDRYEHLIVTDLGTGPHCLFVRDFNSATSEFTCLNSWGPNNNPTPVVNSMDITHYYRVSAMASKLKMQQTSSQASTSTTTSNSVRNSTPLQQSISTTPSLTQLPEEVKNWILSNDYTDLKCIVDFVINNLLLAL